MHEPSSAFKVFISHSSKDRQPVEDMIVLPLTRNGIETWYSTTSIKSASEWERKVREGLRICEWFLVYVTNNSVRSDWVRAEVHWAFEHRRDKIIPVLAEDCSLEELHLMLSMIHYVDFRRDVDKGFREMLSIWGIQPVKKVEVSGVQP